MLTPELQFACQLKISLRKKLQEWGTAGPFCHCSFVNQFQLAREALCIELVYDRSGRLGVSSHLKSLVGMVLRATLSRRKLRRNPDSLSQFFRNA